MGADSESGNKASELLVGLGEALVSLYRAVPGKPPRAGRGERKPQQGRGKTAVPTVASGKPGGALGLVRKGRVM